MLHAPLVNSEFLIMIQKIGTPHPMIATPNNAEHTRVITWVSSDESRTKISSPVCVNAMAANMPNVT